MKLTIVRHGETIENAKGILIGHSHGALTPLGRRQAKALAKKLSKDKFEAIYCSDLKRCQDTAKEIIKYHKHVPISYSRKLRERNLGEFENLPVGQAGFDKLKGSYLTRKPKGGESHNDVKKRVREFLRFLKQKHKKENVLLVTHGAVIRVLKHVLTKTDMRQILKKYGSAKNTGVSEYTIEGNRIVEHRYNAIDHLFGDRTAQDNKK